MDEILIYSDSLTWGIIPNTRQRLPYNKRWPGVFDGALKEHGLNVRVIENCLNGRRTVWSDPYKSGRDGSENLAQTIEMHSPLKIVIVLLGSNDFQCTHNNNAWLSAQGMAKLINTIRTAPIEPGLPIPQIMVVAPPKIVKPKGAIANKFLNAEQRSIGLAQELEMVAKEHSVFYFDANTVITASEIDGIHLDEAQHQVLGKALADEVKQKIF